MNQPIAIGVENNYYYIDKTWMIKELIDQAGSAKQFTRPRQFGKTLTLSMIRTFFEDERTYDGEKIDNSRYFSGKRILTAGEKYVAEMGKYPVIKLSLKSAKQPDFQMAYHCLRDEIAKEYSRHRYILKSEKLIDADREQYTRVMNRLGTSQEYATAIQFLSQCLKEYHQKNVIILIDEYDVPLENAYFRGFYGQMVDFIRSLFESALKTNDALEFAIVTGCLRISKESIFTGYLKVESKRFENRITYLTMSIPNDEVLTIYENTIREWFDCQVKAMDIKSFYQAALAGDAEQVETFVSDLLENSISYYDKKEDFHHGIMVRLFGGISGYEMQSNRE